jgi:ABC-2 type transport system ATP-binding protein
MPVLDVQGLRKTFGSVTAVEEISFSVEAGEVFTIIGPNGAGKTTTLEMIEGLLPPDAGTITVDGLKDAKNPQKAMELLTYLVSEQGNNVMDFGREGQTYTVVDGKNGYEPGSAEVQADGSCRLREGSRINDSSMGTRQRVALASNGSGPISESIAASEAMDSPICHSSLRASKLGCLLVHGSCAQRREDQTGVDADDR